MTVSFARPRKSWLPGTLLLLAASSVWAQATAPSPATTLKQAFDSAWQRQPEAQSQAARQQAASAQRQAADSWTAQPASLAFSIRSDRLNQNLGSREIEAELALPLWLPGERARSGALAEAEVRASASRVLAAQLRTAANVRESYWQWQRASGEHELALARLRNAQQLAADVAQRVKAGDLARADQHQADGALASAQAGVAQAASALAGAAQQLRALSGAAPEPGAIAVPGVHALTEPLPELPADVGTLENRHPALVQWADQAELARRAAELALVQTRPNPELSLSTASERGRAGEPDQQSITLGLRIPFGSDSRNRAKQATAQADALEAQGLRGLEQERLRAELDSARVRLESARIELTAADKRLQLAHELRSFFQKSYQMGETDLPTRLRIEHEATEAQRQVSRTRIDLAAAVSALRQALGLLPE